MLKQRVITAIVLLAILLPALFYRTPVPFCVVAMVLIAAGAWEWGRLNPAPAADGGSPATSSATATPYLLAVICLALCGASWYVGLLERSLPLLWSVAGAAWVLAGAWLLKNGVAGWPRIPRMVRLTMGVIALWLAWLAVAQARFVGVGFLLSVLMLVWVADIGAYFAGKGLGGRFSKGKLAPSISPGKSWEGVWGGMAGVVLMALLWISLDWSSPGVPGSGALDGSLHARLADRHGVWLLVVAVVFLAAMSVVGDLVESLVKRSAGAKDSSNLLPGHGGVLDRVDALLPTLPLAMMLVSF
ncbi:MAG: phosphatidate cytidylyltransferase [Comamonadaceae bacterium]|nr:MAG: phosphatidate cytidylyltransferase [Comamonadaceae bacterium]